MVRYDLMKAPADYRNTWRKGVIQIHITRACDLSCVACTQGSNLGGRPVMISLQNFEIAVSTLTGYFGVVGVFGGNPTMHPQFEEICRILAKWVPFEQRGLWSNNLRGYGKLCREIFNPAYSNLNVHTSRTAYHEMKKDWPECNPIGLYDSRHSPPFVSMKDLGITGDTADRLIENCDINQNWSAMLCEVNGQVKAYFCEIAGAQAMLLNDASTGVEPFAGWWKKPMEYFSKQVERHCYECGVPLKGKGDLAVAGTKEFVSETYLPVYKLKNKRELVVVKTKEELGGHVTRATDYINNGVPPAQLYPEYER